MALLFERGAELEQNAGQSNSAQWYENASDEDLVVAALVADFTAFEALIARHRPAVTGVAQSIIGSRATAEDIAQDTFVAAFQSLPNLNDPARFGAWACTIARYRSLRVSSRERKIQTVDSEPLEALINGSVDRDWRPRRNADPADESVRKAERSAVWDSLRLLSTEHQEVLSLHYCDDLSLEQISECLALPATTIKGRLFRGREALRSRLLANSTFSDRVKGTNINGRK